MRILGWYVVLLAIALTGALLLQRALLLAQVGTDVDSALEQEVGEMRALASGSNPETGEPFEGDVASIFTTFLARNVPLEGEAVLTLINGEPHAADVRGGTLVDILAVEEWTDLTATESGEITDIPGGPVRYLAVPLLFDGVTRGVFVVAVFMEGRFAQVEGTIRLGALVYGSIFLVATAVAWVAAGRVLRPLRSLTQTARSIGESDLSQRIAVEGSDEVAELGYTFNSMLDRLEAAFEAQRRFIDDAGHELRTPITIIRGQLEVMGDDPTELEEVTSLVTDELDRMSRIVDDLLVLATAEQPEFVMAERIDLEEFTNHLILKARSLSHREWQLDGTGEGVFTADRQRLTQAMMNLMSNALDHTAPGVPVAVGSRRADGWVVLWVRDEGPGVPLTDQAKIFDRFVRGRGGRRSASGAGLGLAIVKAIAEAHKGSATVESGSDGGATFTVSIPITFGGEE